MKGGALQGDGLALEPLRPEHAERLRTLRDAPEVARWWDVAPPGWPLEVDTDCRKFAITVAGEVVGFLQYYEEPDQDMRRADLDIFVAPGHHGRGLGPEAMRTVIRHLTQDRGHHRITLSTSPDNHRAIGVYEKLGFRRIGVTRKSALRVSTGVWQDELLMELVL